MLSEDHLEHVELDSTLYVYILRLPGAQGLGREGVIFDAREVILDTSEEGIPAHVEGRGSVDDVGEIEVDYVVPSDDIGVNLDEEVSPGLQKLLFTPEAVHLGANDGGTCPQGEDIAHQGLSLAMHLHNVGNLNDRVALCLRELSLLRRALDVKG